jgi:MraZ protein
MFIGQYSHSIDAKGRINIPSRYREELGDQFFITKGIDECLVIYKKEDFYELLGKLEKLSITNESLRNYVRNCVIAAAECVPDKNGRIVISQSHRQYAGLEKDIVSAGVISRIEIWNSKKFEEKENSEIVLDDEARQMLKEVGL